MLDGVRGGWKGQDKGSVSEGCSRPCGEIRASQELFFSLVPSPWDGFPADTLGVGCGATDESWTCPLVGVALLVYVRVGTLRLSCAGPQAKGCHPLWLQPWLGQEKSATDAGSKSSISLTLRFKQVL